MREIDAFQIAFERFWRREPDAGDVAFVCRPRPRPLHEHPNGEYTSSDRPVAEWVDWYAREYERQVWFAEQIGGWNVPAAHLTTGTHIYAAAFGCPVHRFEDSNPAALPCLSTVEEAEALREPVIEKSPTPARVLELGHALMAKLGPRTPLGPPDLQTGFDTAALVWNKEDFYCALATAPDTVERLVEKCARLFQRFVALLRREFPTMSPAHCPRVWAPPYMAPWASNDECGAISPAAFERFCLPELVNLAESFGGLGMHCCADAEHQFSLFHRIPGFYAFNRVPARAGWDGLTAKFGGPDGPILVLAWVPEETVVRLVADAPAGTRFVFVQDCDSPDDALRFLDRMHAEMERLGRSVVAADAEERGIQGAGRAGAEQGLGQVVSSSGRE